MFPPIVILIVSGSARIYGLAGNRMAKMCEYKFHLISLFVDKFTNNQPSVRDLDYIESCGIREPMVQVYVHKM